LISVLFARLGSLLGSEGDGEERGTGVIEAVVLDCLGSMGHVISLGMKMEFAPLAPPHSYPHLRLVWEPHGYEQGKEME
jgi:hypothetical protein